MADTIIGGSGTGRKLVRWDAGLEADLKITLAFEDLGTVVVNKAGGSSTTVPNQVEVTQLGMGVDTANAYTLSGVSFSFANKVHQLKAEGDVQTDINPSTGVGTKVGQLDATQLTVTSWPAQAAPGITNFRGLAAPPLSGAFSPFSGFQVMFRTAVAPLRPGSVTIIGNLLDGTVVNVTADEVGIINTPRVKGRVNYDTGVIDIYAVRATAVLPGQVQSSLAYLGITGVDMVYLDSFKTDTLRYNAVAFTYLPLNSELLGIDPVRLPSDGRVPIFAPSYLLVFTRSDRLAAQSPGNGAVINIGHERLSRVRLIGSNDQAINSGWSVNLEAGTITVTSTAGWNMPVRVEWHIEDMVQCRDAQLSGDVSFLPPLSHAYPADGKSFCSSALAFGDLVARVSHLFDLATFDPTFSDTPGAGDPDAEYDDTNAPIEVTNRGAITQRWQLVFTSATAFRVVGQDLGQIDIGTTTEDCAPINPNTGVPYFRLKKEGWGAGWNTGSCLRMNTVACGGSAWLLRTIRQGAAAGSDYSFQLLPRGDIDNPIP